MKAFLRFAAITGILIAVWMWMGDDSVPVMQQVYNCTRQGLHAEVSDTNEVKCLERK